VKAFAIAAVIACAVAGGTRAGAGVAPAWADQQDPPHEKKLVHTDHAMGTVVQVTIWSDDEVAAAAAAQAVFAEMRRLDAMMTTWTPDSEISQINTAAGNGKPVKVSDEAFTVIARSVDISRQSKGIFDITVGAYSGMWKFDQDMDGTLPAPADVAARRELVNWKDIVLDKRKKTVRLKRAGMKITLGGIAKGYAVDRAAAVMDHAGFGDFIIQAGGDMYVSGSKSGTSWVVGIRDPRGTRDQSFAIAPVRDHSFSTSGDYERGFVKDGVRYHHILDPRTGQPSRASRSVTIMAKDAFTADAWSKVLFILGAKQAMPLVEKLPNFEAVFVDDANRVIVSSGLLPTLKVLSEPTPGV